MAKLVVLLSGPVSSGKSTLAAGLVERFGFHPIKTWELLRTHKQDIDLERESLQLLGEELDRETNGEWVLSSLAPYVSMLEDDATVVVDAVRIKGQIEALRRGFGQRVVHVHLTAPDEVLERRYKTRKRGDIQELTSYSKVQENQTEAAVPQLADFADVVIDTKRCTESDVLVQTAAHLNLYGRGYDRLVDVIVGGQYGSEGKGQVAAYLAPDYDLLIRVGGPNAGHKVYEEPEPYTFHTLPSGTRKSSASLVLGAGAVIYVPRLQKEIAECQIEASRLSIDPQAMIITEEDRANEAELVKKIGSTGQGVGYATSRRIRDRGVNEVTLAKDIPTLKPFIRDTYEIIESACRDGAKIQIEGTQGTGLSLFHGTYPYVTSRDTTVAGCLAEAGVSPSRVRKVVMVCRTYPIRVGDPEGATSGPMSQGVSLAEVARRSELNVDVLRKTEKTSTTNRPRKFGEFDWAFLKKSAFLNAPTDIALTFVDYIDSGNTQARRFDQLTDQTIEFIEQVERVAHAPVSLISTRFHFRSIIDRRRW